MFYTRIPCPSHIDHSAEYINKATRYFPLIGWIVGGLSFLTFQVSSLLFEPTIAESPIFVSSDEAATADRATDTAATIVAGSLHLAP